MKDLTLAEIKHVCSANKHCETCPFYQQRNIKLCDIALRVRELSDKEMETEYAC